MGSRLAVTNAYLRDRAMRQRAVFTSVATSSAIEGIHAPFAELADRAGEKKRPANAKPARAKARPRLKR